MKQTIVINADAYETRIAILEDNELAAQIYGPALLSHGLFRNNGTALLLSDPPSPEQVIGVSLEGNDFDLVVE